MTHEEREQIMEALAFSGPRIRELANKLDDYIDELEEKIENLEAKEFVR